MMMKLNENALKAKLQQTNPTDERTTRVNEKGLAACGAIAFFYVVGKLIWCGLQNHLAVPELILLFVMVICMTAIERQNGVYQLPTAFGKPIDPETTPLPKRMGLYALSSFLYAVSWAAADCVFKVTTWEPMPLRILMDIVISTAVFFVIDLAINEHKIKQYQKAMEQLDDEENRIF